MIGRLARINLRYSPKLGQQVKVKKILTQHKKKVLSF